MRVLFVTAEAYPLAKTGGLADVSRALPIALMGRGVDVHLLIPGYPGAFTRVEKPRFVAKLDPILGVSDGMLVSGTVPDTELPVWLVDAPSLYRRTGSLYQDENGQEWPDNALRFAYLSHVANKLAMGRTKLAWRPDVVHANDWHAGLLPLLLSLEKAPRPHSVFTTHNMAFQGNFPATALPIIDVPDDDFTTNGFEFYGQVSFLESRPSLCRPGDDGKPKLRQGDSHRRVWLWNGRCSAGARLGISRESSTELTIRCGILRLIIIFPKTIAQATSRANECLQDRVTAGVRAAGKPGNATHRLCQQAYPPKNGGCDPAGRSVDHRAGAHNSRWWAKEIPSLEAAFAEAQAAGNRENLSVTIGYEEPWRTDCKRAAISCWRRRGSNRAV